MIERTEITAEVLEAAYRFYELREDGFYWKDMSKDPGPNRRRWSGKRVGNAHPSGYRRIRISLDGVSSGSLYTEHRVIFFAHFGYVPEFIDHINRNSLDNRICNLRAATATQSCQNQGIRKDNTSGFRGVSWNPDRKKWLAVIQNNGRMRRLGYFDDKAVAATVYEAARAEMFGDFA